MNILKQFVWAAVFATLLGSSSLAVAKSGWQTEELYFGTWTEYVNCLEETVELDLSFTIKYREFETPSGTYHYVESWSWVGTLVGLDSERVWIEEGFSPGAIVVAKAEVGQWTAHGVAKPVVGDGPRLRYSRRFKYTINANGDLKVEYESPAFGSQARCLGPKEK